MKRHTKRTAAVLSAAALTLCAVPAPMYSHVAEAADEYSVRDPFYNYGKGYNYYESEHFQFIWGNSGDASKVTQTFLEQNAKNMEACWHVYMDELGMTPPCESVNMSLRDGKKYKTNIYISGTGLEGMQDDWAYMSYDNGGYAYMFCCVDSMRYDPPSWVFPHEFGHVMTAHQLGWNSNKYSYAWWEALGNWFREQYLYSDYSTDETGHGTDFFETYMKNLSFTFPLGRDYYAAWPFLQYLTENPEGLEGYGSEFVKTMLQQGKVDEFPFDQVERLAPADLKDTLGYFAAHMAGLDFRKGDAYRARLSELLAQGDWNWQQIYTMPEADGRTGTFRVPTERAPQFAGLNIIPLEVTGSSFTAELNPETDVQGADWRACVVQQTSDGKCTYSALFGPGEKVAVDTVEGANVYLSVIATPELSTVKKYGLPGIYDDRSEFSESNVPFSTKTQYPYSVTFNGGADDNVKIKERKVSTTSANWWEQATYNPHPNGGGLVASTAKVDSSVYVAPGAVVKGDAVVTGNVRILDHAVVEGSAKVSDNAVIAGYGMVAENAVVSGNARVDDCGLVMGRANISGNAKVIESACVYGNTTMKDHATAKGIAFLMADSSLSEQGIGDGDLYSDNNIKFTKGTSYGWTSAQSYADKRPYTDKLMYAYDFDGDSSLSFADRYTSTYGVNVGAQWEASRTSANGVLTFDGASYAEIDKGVLYTDDIEIQLSFLSRKASGSGESILYLGDSDDRLELSIGEGNSLNAVLKTGDNEQKLTAENAVVPGEWTKVRFILDGDKGQLIVNDTTAAEGSITLDPSDIADALGYGEGMYRIGGGTSPFKGSVDFVRVFYGAASAPAETYSEKEEIAEDPTQPSSEETSSQDDILWGDANCDNEVNMADAVLVMQYLANPDTYGLNKPDGITDRGRLNADVYDNGDGVTNSDASAIQEYKLGLVDALPVSYLK